MEIDQIDRKIVSLLADDATKPLRVLATSVGISFVALRNRIKKLESLGIISRTVAIIDSAKLGYDVTVMINCRISKGQMAAFEKKVAVLPQVYAVYDVTGDFDVVIFARFENTRQLDSFLKKIQGYDFVERINTSLVLNTLKEGQVV